MTGSFGWRRRLTQLVAGTMLVLGLVVLPPAPPASALCSGRSWFGGQHYCPASIEGVQATKYGVGRRVWLGGTVSDVSTGTVTLAQLRDDCPPPEPGHFCGASLYYVFLTVPWSGTHRPADGAVIRLYAITTDGSSTPVGYVRTGFCPIEYC
jgi:hypothetical protein